MNILEASLRFSAAFISPSASMILAFPSLEPSASAAIAFWRSSGRITSFLKTNKKEAGNSQFHIVFFPVPLKELPTTMMKISV